MKEEKRNIPEVRFREFAGDNADAWELRKLGEVANITMGQSPNSANYTNNPKDYILVQGNADIKDGKVVPRVWTTQITKKAFKGNILLSVRAPVGDVGITDYDIVIGRGVASLTGSSFIYQLLKKMKNSGYWNKFVTGSTFESINSNDVKNAITTVPQNKLEQQKIGTFFKHLDELITLHQRELDNLKVLKKTLLSKMFPKNDEKYPEIRFSGFADAWELRRIGECFEERSSRSEKGELISVTINSGIIKASELERKDISSSSKANYKVVRVGDIAYNSMRMWQGASGYSPYNGILSPAYTVLKPKEDIYSKFFAQYFKRSDVIWLFRINSQGLTSDTWNLKFPALSKIYLRVPTINEQIKIAKYFKHLDELITLHQRELDDLKVLKKTLLSKMFV
ncbi:restriction endonuclease subunit S [Ligilactobacillus apodemi]|uniref:Type I restriction modification DNA specificity domain-containing protein n=1 Tax=Ligilactobacillus apodemi DSM 16634 = JCM 16172 TaxID=1423724 RepID=A0A0R1TXA2_9LACO|nr:restriction endonuclease subunit S [Ligilactobacillus apodemi]KRL83658.1 hypothetical protein FC32_GL000918 [Ligilactobacillus apodemi DSM 16634 = JCM 16172]